MGWAARIPTSAGTKLVKRYGYPSKAKAEADAGHAGKLLDLAGADEATRARIGDLIAAAKRGAPLPALEDVRRRLGLGLDPGTPGMTAGEWLDTWLAAKQRSRRASTVHGYRSHVALYLKPILGDMPLERLNASHVEAVLAAVGGTPANRHRVLATLRAALNAAVKQRRITYNPCSGIELEPERPPEAKRWTPAEANRFIDHTAGDPLGLAFHLMVMCGIRRGELCGLRWKDVDLGQGVLTLNKTVIQLGGKVYEGEDTKTRASRRVIVLDAEITELLGKHQKAQRKAQLAAPPGVWEDHGLVFCRDNGRPLYPDYVSKRFRRLAAGAGVPVIKLHEGGRHTGNSLLYDAQVRPDIVRRRVGHTTDEMSQRYNHPEIEAHRDAAERVRRLVRGTA
jgi:integrase